MIESSLRGKISSDEWFKKLPGVFQVYYQGTESSTSESILKKFEKARLMVQSERMKADNMIPWIIFDEIGLAEKSEDKPLKVLHSLLEVDNNDIAFVGISNWRLDASKMNRAVFLARPDLSLEDLESQAQCFLKTENTVESEHICGVLKTLAKSYFNYKNKLKDIPRYREFHGTRDFYSLTSKVSKEILDNKIIKFDKELIKTIQISLERNFEGIKSKSISIKKEFLECIVPLINDDHLINFEKKSSTLDLIKMNLEDSCARYLMLIIKSDSALYILDNYLSSHFKNRHIFVGSKFIEDNKKEGSIYNKRTLNDLIICIQKGETVVMQDSEYIYGSLYDLFNKTFLINGVDQKVCRIALGSVLNTTCPVNEKFRCIILVHEQLLKYYDPPFLNRFEKYCLSFESIMNKKAAEIVENIKRWQDKILNLVENIDMRNRHKNLNKEMLVANNHDELVESLVFSLLDSLKEKQEMNDTETNEFVEKNCKEKLIQISSNYAILVAVNSKMKKENENEVNKFFEIYLKIFEKYPDFKTYITENQDFKALVYTFDNITKDLNLDREKYKEIKIGNIKAEKFMIEEIKRFAQSDKLTLIIRLDWRRDAHHLNSIKFLIDRMKLQKKKVCILIHLHFNGDIEKNLNKYKLTFLSGYEQIIFDRLDEKKTDICDLLNLKFDEIITHEKIIEFKEIVPSLLVNCISKFKYIDENSIESSQKIYEYKKNILKYLTSNEKLVCGLLKEKVFESINNTQFNIWKLEILTDDNLFSFEWKSVMKNMIISAITIPFIQYLHILERHFPFECLLMSENNNTEEIEKLFLVIAKNELENKSQIMSKYANQSNVINVHFGLKIPFIVKELEIFKNTSTISIINEFERRIAYMEPEISSDDKNQILNKIKESKEEYKEFYSANCLFSTANGKVLENYFHDLINLKYKYAIDRIKGFSDFIYNLIKVCIKKNGDNFNFQNVFYYSSKYAQLMIKLTSVHESVFKNEFKRKIMVAVFNVQLYENVDSILIEKYLIENLIRYIFDELLVINEHLEMERFIQLFIEVISIKCFKTILSSVLNSIYFISELSQLILKIFGHKKEQAKKKFIEILKIIDGNVKNRKFLQNLEHVKAIKTNLLELTNTYNVKEDINKFITFLFRLALDENYQNEEMLNTIFDHFSKDKYAIPISGPLFENIIASRNINIDLNLNFLTHESVLLKIINDKLSEIGVESDFAVIFVEVMSKNIEFVDDFKSFVKSNLDNLKHLFEVLKNCENALKPEIRYTKIALLTSLAIFRHLILFHYSDEVDKHCTIDEDYVIIFNQFLSKEKNPDSFVWKSLSSFALRTLKTKKDSYNEFLDYIKTNIKLEWAKKNFKKLSEAQKKKFELYLQDENMDKLDEIEREINLFITNKSDHFSNIHGDALDFLLSAFNIFFTRYTDPNQELNANLENLFHLVIEAQPHLKENFYFEELFQNLILNFKNDEFLKAEPTKNLKLISIIIHCCSIVILFSDKSTNPLIMLFYDTNGTKISNFNTKKEIYWLCTEDSEEFIYLNSMNVDSKSFSISSKYE